MHPMKVFLALSLILGVAFANISSKYYQLQGDDLMAAKELLTRNVAKLPGPKLKIVTWLRTEFSPVSGTLYKYVVDVSNGSYQNECTFRILQTLSAIMDSNEINMRSQGGGQELNQHW